MKKNGFVMSTYVYMLLVFFLLLLATMLTVLNNTKLLSNKLRNDTAISSGLLDKNFCFVLQGDREVTLFKGDEYEDAGFIAKTNTGKDLKENVKITGEVDNTKIGDYTITYKLTYNGMSKELKRDIHVVDEFTYYLNSIYNTEKGNTDGLKRTTAEYNDVIYDSGLRYTGNNPNNYVYFNCDDDSKESSCEIWRIVGVFDVGGEERIKIININSTFKASWDSSAVELNKGAGINQWGPSTKTNGSIYEGAALYRLLNGFYIGASDECKYCNDAEQEECPNTCTNESLASENMKPLTSSAKNLISNAKWNTYGVDYEELKNINATNINNAWLQENGISKQYTGKECIDGDEYCNDTVIRTTSQISSVGLASVCDIGYASEWINGNNYSGIWTITPATHSETSATAWLALTQGIVASVAPSSINVFPTVYLKSNVKKIGGTGTSITPYKLEI